MSLGADDRDRWSIHHFSISNRKGPGQGDVAALLRNAARALDDLGDVQVADITFHSEVTGGEDLTLTGSKHAVACPVVAQILRSCLVKGGAENADPIRERDRQLLQDLNVSWAEDDLDAVIDDLEYGCGTGGRGWAIFRSRRPV